jgi:DNA-3-methyladenine glycosylase
VTPLALQRPAQGTSIRPLTRAFYDGDPRHVGRKLLGKVLVRQTEDEVLTGRIVEVEAYLGAKDLAAHSAAGCTARNSVLFGPPGYAYVYFIYGNHYCLNVSCEPDGKAGGILFRALEPLTGMEDMARARGVSLHGSPPYPVKSLIQLTSGPGRLSEAFGITRDRDNGRDLTSPASGLWIGEDDYRPRGIRVTPRIGITKSADQMLRYILSESPFISRKIRVK